MTPSATRVGATSSGPTTTASRPSLSVAARPAGPPRWSRCTRFTPVYKGVARPWQVGVLYNRDPRFAHLLMALLRNEAGMTVGDNEPYAVTDDTDYTVPVHGERRGLHHTAVEIRQDLIADDAGQRQWGVLMARLLPAAYTGLESS